MNTPDSPQAGTAPGSGPATPVPDPARPAPDPALLHAARGLLSRGNHMAWKHADHALALRAGVGQQHAAALPCLCLEHGTTRLRVAVEHEHGTPPDGDAHWRDYSGEARVLAWTLANETLQEALSELFGNPLLATGFETEGGCNHLWLAFTFKDAGGRVLEGWLGIGTAEARRLAEHEAWQHDPERLPLLGDTEVLGLELWLPGPLLSTAERSEIAGGDVLLLDHGTGMVAQVRPTRETRDTVLGLPDAWSARHEEGQWRVTERGLLQSGDDARLHFRLAPFTMALHEAARLQPGTPLVHDALLPGKAVEVMLGQRRFAAATLVVLGERLGARIDHLEGEHGFQ